MTRSTRAVLVAAGLALSPGLALAQAAAGAPAPPPSSSAAPSSSAPSMPDAERRKLEADIARELGATPSQQGAPAQPGGAPQPPGAAQAPQGTAPAAGSTGGNPFARLLLMPDLSAIGSFAGVWNHLDVGALSPRGGPFAGPDKLAFQFEELELGLQAVVDPYLRADVFVSFSPEGVDVEEAYATTLSLPAGLQLKAGKFFSPFGRMNQQHPHVWEFVDAPLARKRLLADETLSGPGVQLGWLTPLPWYAELQVAVQSTAPAAGDPEALTGIARLQQYFPFGDATTLGVGLSGARRSEGTGAFRDLGGADVYVRIRPPASRSYLALQGEVYARKLRGVEDADASTRTGWWSQAFWRQDVWWGWGVRYEEAPGDTAGQLAGTERRASALAAWLPSEFSRLRLQVSYDRLPGGKDGVEAIIHLEFGIGAHGAHPF